MLAGSAHDRSMRFSNHYAPALVMALWLADRGLGFAFVILWAA
jgi:hypothetical protein